MYSFIYVLKAIAAILITNSHYGSVWPTPALATGGAIGNTLFFLVSGFCLSNTNCGFFIWIKKRFLRLYPSVIIATVIGIVLGVYSVNSIETAIKLFVWPTAYWFVGVIAIFYVVFYYISKYMPQKYVNFIYPVVVLVYAIFYSLLDTSKWVIEDIIWFKSIFYFGVMLTGWSLKQYTQHFTIRITPIAFFVLSIISLFGFYGQKALCVIEPNFYSLQYIQHIFLAVLSISIFLFLYSLEIKMPQMKSNRVWKSVVFLANHSLEIYVIQVPILRLIGGKISFPLSFFVATILILVGAWAIPMMFSILKAIWKLRK